MFVKLSKQATRETSSLWGKLDFEANPIRANGPSAADKQIQYDRKLSLTILPPAPALHISFTPIPADVLAGEIIPVTVSLLNAGTEMLTSIYVAAEDSRWILVESDSQDFPLSLLRGTSPMFERQALLKFRIKEVNDSYLFYVRIL